MHIIVGPLLAIALTPLLAWFFGASTELLTVHRVAVE
jgi:hypothetical protein